MVSFMNEETSIRDVADKSGFSIATVSRILNRKPGASAATQKKVLAACEALGYRLNPAIQDLARKGWNRDTNNLVFVIAGKAFSDPAYSGALDGIARGINEFGYNLALAGISGKEKNIYELPPLLREGRFDGIIITGNLSRNIMILMEKLEKPHVVLGVYSDEIVKNANCIRLNITKTIAKLVNALKRKGKKRIAYFTEYSDSFYEMRCLDAFKLELKRNKLVVDKRIIFCGKGAFSGAVSLLGPVLDGPSIPFDSIVCLNFRCAQEICYLILSRYGIKNEIGILPATLSVMSNYKLPIPAVYCNGIIDEIAYMGVKTLIMMLKDKGYSHNLKLELTPDLLDLE